MTELELRKLYVDTLRGYLGAREGDERHRELIDYYNSMPVLPRGYKMTYTADWCVATAVAVGVKLGLESIILAECSCTRLIAMYKAIGRFVEGAGYLPQIGDFVIYDWQGDADPDHWGTVAEVEGDMLVIIEGNMADRVDTRLITLDDPRIYGYCLPDYASMADREPAPVFVDVPQDAWYAEAVAYCARHELMVGREDGSFDPLAPVTRAELAAVVQRLHQALSE
ncbi:MAG: S-layer homology domain-containing protein [Oscillospiraceae bacterium]|nr:S-layer homology domain-containing protein [Oscillospiraceae bacterium]